MNIKTDDLTAKAVWFDAPRSAVLREERVRPPGPTEIQVTALRSLISAGSELNLYRGEGNLPSLEFLPTTAGTLPFPVKFGYQVVGRVEVAGEHSGCKVGDRVFVMHPHQDKFTLTVQPPFVYRVPDSLDTVAAAFLGMFQVGMQVQLEVPVHAGDCVAVSGSGIIGSFVSYLARLSAGKLIMIDPLPARRKLAEWIGADAIVSPEEAHSTIMRLTKGRGVDTFVETSGAAAALQMAINSTGNLGNIAVAAWYGTRPVSLSLSPDFHLKSHRITSVFVGQLGGNVAARWDYMRKIETAGEFLGKIDARKLITHHIPFARAPEAYQLLDQKPGETLGVMLDY